MSVRFDCRYPCRLTGRKGWRLARKCLTHRHLVKHPRPFRLVSHAPVVGPIGSSTCFFFQAEDGIRDDLVTGVQTCALPISMMWVMRRAGVRLPEAMTSTFMTFVATVVFFAVAGPLAIYLGAGKSLAQHNVVLGITYYGLFRTSLTIFGILGVVMLFAMVFPSWLRDGVHWLAGRLERKSHRIAARIEQLREGIDRAHECLVAFGNPKGWVALFWAVLLSAPSHANKLLAGYVALRALGIPANFVDILLLQTFITFLLYFAPTPGASGLAELLSAAVMQIYVRREITATYILIWRFINSYATVIVGSLLFWYWLRRGVIGQEEVVALPDGGET